MGQRAGAVERRGQSGATRAAVGHRRGKRGQRVQRVGFGHALEPLKHFISRLGVAGGQRGGAGATRAAVGHALEPFKLHSN